jgi:hypothetical protein
MELKHMPEILLTTHAQSKSKCLIGKPKRNIRVYIARKMAADHISERSLQKHAQHKSASRS